LSSLWLPAVDRLVCDSDRITTTGTTAAETTTATATAATAAARRLHCVAADELAELTRYPY